MERVGLILLSIAVATLLLVGASLGAEWLQPHIWQIAQQKWFPPVMVGLLPGLYLIGHWLRRKRAHS